MSEWKLIGQRTSEGSPQKASEWKLIGQRTSEPSLLEKAGSAAAVFNRPIETLRIPEIAGGAIQGAAEAGRSLADLPLGLINKLAGTNLRAPEVNLQQYARQDPASRAAFMGGEVLGSIGPYGALTKALTEASGASSLGKMMGVGAGTGYALGEGSGDESNLGDTGRLIGGALGGAFGGLGATGRKSLAKRIVAEGQKREGLYSQKYNDIMSDVRRSGLHKPELKVPSELQRGKAVPPDLATAGHTTYTKSLRAFRDNPTFENAHRAQSDMGKFERTLKDALEKAKYGGKSVGSEKTKALELAKKMKAKIRGSMWQHLTDNERPDLISQYADTTAGYRKDVVPYLNSALKNRGAKDITGAEAKKMIDKLHAEKAFDLSRRVTPSGEEYVTRYPIDRPAGLGARQALDSKTARKIKHVGALGALIGAGAAAGVHLPYYLHNLLD